MILQDFVLKKAGPKKKKGAQGGYSTWKTIGYKYQFSNQSNYCGWKI